MSDGFIIINSEFYTTQDIYDNNGHLLLSKGQKVTQEIKNRLDRFGKYDLKKPNHTDDEKDDILASNDKQNTVFAPITKELVKKMNIRDNLILDKPNEILINIIFESKTQPWWIYINALSKYVDWLYTHSIDVAMISLMIAIELGYSDEELYSLGVGTLLHDVGKLLIPRSILLKSEKLNDIEMSIIKQHCELGMSSLEGFDLLKEYIDIVMQHHERLDGSGYPNGLKGEEICYNAKIIMIADTVDAITSYRPYRQLQKMDDAIRLLRDEKGKYSQELVSLLEKIIE